MNIFNPVQIDSSVFDYNNTLYVAFYKKNYKGVYSVRFSGSRDKLKKIQNSITQSQKNNTLKIITCGQNETVLCIKTKSNKYIFGEDYFSFIYEETDQEKLENNTHSLSILKEAKISSYKNVFLNGRKLSKDSTSHYSLDWRDPKKFIKQVFIIAVVPSFFKVLMLNIHHLTLSMLLNIGLTIFATVFVISVFLISIGYLTNIRRINKILKQIQ